MYQDREQVRQVYLRVWQKMQHQRLLEPMEALIAEVIEIHPEYHALLAGDSEIVEHDFTPEDGRTNPFLHMGMHIALREQAGADRPPGVKSIYRQLTAQRGRHDAEHAMMECLGGALWTAQRSQQSPDEDAYLGCLKKLLN